MTCAVTEYLLFEAGPADDARVEHRTAHVAVKHEDVGVRAAAAAERVGPAGHADETGQADHRPGLIVARAFDGERTPRPERAAGRVQRHQPGVVVVGAVDVGSAADGVAESQVLTSQRC